MERGKKLIGLYQNKFNRRVLHVLDSHDNGRNGSKFTRSVCDNDLQLSAGCMLQEPPYQMCMQD